jgi:hypothetical protein
MARPWEGTRAARRRLVDVPADPRAKTCSPVRVGPTHEAWTDRVEKRPNKRVIPCGAPTAGGMTVGGYRRPDARRLFARAAGPAARFGNARSAKNGPSRWSVPRGSGGACGG